MPKDSKQCKAKKNKNKNKNLKVKDGEGGKKKRRGDGWRIFIMLLLDGVGDELRQFCIV